MVSCFENLVVSAVQVINEVLHQSCWVSSAPVCRSVKRGRRRFGDLSFSQGFIAGIGNRAPGPVLANRGADA